MVIGIGVEGPGVGDHGPACRVVQRHQVFAASPRPNRHAASYDLAEGGDVGCHAETLLGSPGGQPEALHLVEDEDDTKLRRQVPDALQELRRCGHVAKIGADRLHDDAGQAVPVLADDVLRRLQVVVWEHYHVVQDTGRLAGPLGDGRGAAGIQLA